MTDNLPDGTLLLEVGKGLAGERAVNLQAIDEGSDGDEAVRLDVLVELVRGGLVEDDGVLGLVLNCKIVSGGSQYSDIVAWQFECAMRCERRSYPIEPVYVFYRALLTHDTGPWNRVLEVLRILWCARFTYPFPWTTSSSASCHLLLRVPAEGQFFALQSCRPDSQSHTILSDVVDVMEQRLLRSV